jgi:hypothetical protein
MMTGSHTSLKTPPQSIYLKITLLFSFLLGCVSRFMPVFLSGFPVNDGGMFLSMIRDLRANNFLLPSVTSYNLSGIPFTYPPFGIYVAAILAETLSIPEIELIRWLPPLVSTAIIPVFYWLSRQVFTSKCKAVVATSVYALTPGSADWLVMGGGLTRSLGVLFHLLAVGYVYNVFRNRDKKITGIATLFCSLAVLSHPEAGLQTAVVCFMLFLFYGRDLDGIREMILVALGTAILTAPWWLTVLFHHGLSPFESVIHAGVHETLLASIFYSLFSTQGGLPILPILYVIGVMAVVQRRDFLLVAWVFAPFFADPRNAPAIAIFPLAMLAGEGLWFLGAGLIQSSPNTIERSNYTNESKSIFYIVVGSFFILLLFLFHASYTSASKLSNISLTQDERETMEWVRENTPAAGRFLLITNSGEINPMTDAYLEWFPVLAERRSQNTLQGLEWVLGPDFYPYSQRLIFLQTCHDADCLSDWLEQENEEVEFFLFEKKRASANLIESVRSGLSHDVIYESSSAVIFSVDQ